MKIDGASAIRPATTRRADRTRGAAGAFDAHLATGEEQAGVIAGPAQLAPVDALLALQEVPDPLRGRQRPVKRGNDLLDRLDEIRHGLLLGEIPVHRLRSLAQSLRAESQAVADPRLAEIIGEIELRCAVELAKLGQHMDNL
jgi:hypothetical protein